MDIIDGTSDYLEYEILEEFNRGDMEDMERICKRFLRKKYKIENKELITYVMNNSNNICDNIKIEIESFYKLFIKTHI